MISIIGLLIKRSYGSMDAYYDAAPIVCKVKKENSLFITAEGLAMPCCWTAGSGMMERKMLIFLLLFLVHKLFGKEIKQMP